MISHTAFFELKDSVRVRARARARTACPRVSFRIDRAFVFAPGHSCINDTHMN